jgi:drug/metabolite transporter (DMT)-like permease
MKQNSSNKSWGFILLVLGVLLAFGLSWPMMKLALQHMPPVWLAAIRMGIASLALFVILIISGKKFWLTRQDIPLFVSVGLLQMGLFMLLVNLGLQHVEAGRSAILVYTTPLWVTPVAVLFFKEFLNKLTLLGLTMGLIGVGWLFNPFTFNWHDQAALTGNALLLLAALVWATVILHIRYGTHHSSPLELAPWQALLATIFLTITAIILEPSPHIGWSGVLVAEVGYIGLIATAFGFWGATEMTRRLPAVTTSLIFLGVPIIGLVSSATLLGEKITVNKLVAMVLIITGLVCVVLAKRKLPVSSTPVD